MLKNPIFMREMKGAMRDPKIICLILGYVALLGVILMFLWPTSGIFSLASDSSLNIFTIFLMSNLALILLLVPALTSPSITTERENNSFDLLFTSLMTPGEILRGKLMASIAMIFLVILVSMPVAALCALSGGIDPRLLLRAYFVIVLSAVTYGLLGLALSAVCKQTFTALILCYVTVAFLAGCTWLPYYLMGRLYSLRVVWLAVRSLSPFDALYSLVFPGRYGLSQLSQVSLNPLFTFYVHVGGMLVLFALFLYIFCRYIFAPPRAGMVYAWLGVALSAITLLLLGVEYSLIQMWRANPSIVPLPVAAWQVYGLTAGLDLGLLLVIRKLFEMARKARDRYQDQFEDIRTAAKRKLTWPFYLIDPLRRRKPIASWRNPVLAAELRSKIFGKTSFIIYGLAGCIIASMALLTLVCFQFATQLNPDTVRWVAIIFQLGIVAILAPAISSGSITDELTSRTFKMLRMTPLKASTVVSGKLKAGFLYVSIFLVSSIPVLLSLAYLDISQEEFNLASLWRVGAWCAILVFSTLAFITCGFCASAYSKSTSGATAISYTIAGLLCIVTFAALIPGAFTPQTQNAILTLNPMVSALRLTSDSMFTGLSKDVWIHNLVFLVSISAAFIAASAARVYYIFTHQQ
jgi:ABC-type transport system involved in multi-copper enzyme maturation permease subunit